MARRLESEQNRQYLYRLFRAFPSSVPWVVRVVLFFSLLFILSGFRIVYDSLIGVFPEELHVTRELFLWNWIMCILFSLLSIYLSKRFYRDISEWIERQAFVSNADAKMQIRNVARRFFDVGFGWAPLLLFVLIYVIRYMLMRLVVEPVQLIEGFKNYEFWYLGGDFMLVFVFLISMWSLVCFSLVLHYIAGAFPLRIRDLGEYKEHFGELSKLANLHILVLGLLMGPFFFGILYWAFSGTIQFVYASLFLFVLAGVSVFLVFWLNFSGIQKGLEKTKRTKIADIRSSMGSRELIDLQISLHLQVSIWKVGPKLVDSFLCPLIIAELPILIQYLRNLLESIFH